MPFGFGAAKKVVIEEEEALLESLGIETHHELAFYAFVAGTLYGGGYGLYWAALLAKQSSGGVAVKGVLFVIYACWLVSIMAMLFSAPGFHYWRQTENPIDYDHDRDGDIDKKDAALYLKANDRDFDGDVDYYDDVVEAVQNLESLDFDKDGQVHHEERGVMFLCGLVAVFFVAAWVFDLGPYARTTPARFKIQRQQGLRNLKID